MISDELYKAIEAMKYDKIGNPTGLVSTQWIHLQDAVDKGTVTPMEAYDAIHNDGKPLDASLYTDEIEIVPDMILSLGDDLID